MKKQDSSHPIDANFLPHIDIDLDNIQPMSKKEMKQFEKSDTYKKYVQPTLDREKSLKRQSRKEWWWTKGIIIVNTILALIAAITGIISLILQLL